MNWTSSGLWENDIVDQQRSPRAGNFEVRNETSKDGDHVPVAPVVDTLADEKCFDRPGGLRVKEVVLFIHYSLFEIGILLC